MRSKEGRTFSTKSLDSHQGSIEKHPGVQAELADKTAAKIQAEPADKTAAETQAEVAPAASKVKAEPEAEDAEPEGRKRSGKRSVKSEECIFQEMVTLYL